MSSLFITGFSGFIGRNLLRRIDPEKYENVYCLGRTRPEKRFPQNFQFIEGCICNTQAYARYLECCETVIHLAAATGKAVPDEYFKVNTIGTQLLTRQSQQSGVKNFLYVSTIAAKYSDLARYYYAQSKEQGEQAVRNSRLNYAIVRPTIVIGEESVIWKTLSSLARKPVLFIVGDGTARIQPIYIEDLVDCLLTILNSNCFSNEVFEIGGPEQITFEHLLKRIHHIYHGKDPRVVHIPLKVLSTTISFLEKAFYSILPINAGQLSAFNNDGTIEMNRLFNLAAPQMKSVNGMLRQVVAVTDQNAIADSLDRECCAFVRYLLKQDPTSYVINKYREAHMPGSFVDGASAAHFDRLLLSLSTGSPALAKLVDSYTAIFLKSASVRKKWVLLLAIMESCAPTSEYFDSTDSSSKKLLLARMVWDIAVFLTCLLISVIMFAPLRAILGLYSALVRRN